MITMDFTINIQLQTFKCNLHITLHLPSNWFFPDNQPSLFSAPMPSLHLLGGVSCGHHYWLHEPYSLNWEHLLMIVVA